VGVVSDVRTGTTRGEVYCGEEEPGPCRRERRVHLANLGVGKDGLIGRGVEHVGHRGGYIVLGKRDGRESRGEGVNLLIDK